MVERQLPKLDIAGSSPVSRSTGVRGSAQAGRASRPAFVCAVIRRNLSTVHLSGSRTQVAKGAVCKTAITSSILVGSSIFSLCLFLRKVVTPRSLCIT